jgi:hypothetical protein
MNEEKKAEYIQEMNDWVQLRDSWTRKRFDYQERWHGWRSPLGLGLGFTLVSGGIFLLSLAWTNLVH